MAKLRQGKYRPKNISKYRGDPTNIIYRSGWERRFMVYCDLSPNVVSWGSEEVVVPYKCPIEGGLHRYFIDFNVTVRTKSGNTKTILVEIKPFKQTQEPPKPKRQTKKYVEEVALYIRNQTKWKHARAFAESKGWDFKVLTEYELGIKKAK
jgi:hypothetical protein